MSDIELQFSDDNLSIDLGSELGETNFQIKKKKKKKKKLPAFNKKTNSIFTQAKPKLQPAFNDKTFEMFSNPSKRLPDNPNETEIQSDDDVEDHNEYGQEEFDDDEQDVNYGNEYVDENEIQPSEGYESIEEEKQDLIYKFYRLESKGVRLPKKFNMQSDLQEMRLEYKKITRDASVTSSLKFSKRMLLACVSGLEFLNKRYDPFAVELNGWSENVMENINDGDYDNVFERLHDKYSGRVNTPPELELLLTLGGSAVMFHMTSTMFKQLPNMNDMSKQNPEMMQNLMKSMSQMMNNNNQSSQQHEDPPSPGPGSGAGPSDGRREMKGPSMNMASMFNNMPGGMGPPPPMSTSNMTNTMRHNVPESVISSDSDAASDISDNVRNVSYTAGGTKKRGRKPKVTVSNKESVIDI